MLHDTGNAMTADCLESPAAPRGGLSQRQPAVHPVVVEMAATGSGGRYGNSAGFNFSALGVTVLIHLVIGLALLGLGVHAAHKKKEMRLVTVDLSPPPAAPSPPEKTTTQKLAVTVQQPVVHTPIPPQPMMTLAPPVPTPAPPAAPQPAADTPAQPAPPAPPSLVTASNLGTRMISGSPPHYPLESRSKREQGTVQLLVTLGVNGSIETISVSRSSGFPRLDNAALSAVRRWRWAPTIRDGAPAKVRGIVEIPFVLQGAN